MHPFGLGTHTCKSLPSFEIIFVGQRKWQLLYSKYAFVQSYLTEYTLPNAFISNKFMLYVINCQIIQRVTDLILNLDVFFCNFPGYLQVNAAMVLYQHAIVTSFSLSIPSKEKVYQNNSRS